jgi:hypothetical protein
MDGELGWGRNLVSKWETVRCECLWTIRETGSQYFACCLLHVTALPIYLLSALSYPLSPPLLHYSSLSSFPCPTCSHHSLVSERFISLIWPKNYFHHERRFTQDELSVFEAPFPDEYPPSWWFGQRNNSYIGVYCNKDTKEVTTPRSDFKVQVIHIEDSHQIPVILLLFLHFSCSISVVIQNLFFL